MILIVRHKYVTTQNPKNVLLQITHHCRLLLQQLNIYKMGTTIYGKTKVISPLICYLYLNDSIIHNIMYILSLQIHNIINPDERITLDIDGTIRL